MIEHDPERREADALIALIPDRPCDIVEIGCGDGRLTLRYAHRARSVIAMDPDEARIAAFLKAPPPENVDVRALAIDRAEVADASADVVLLSWAL